MTENGILQEKRMCNSTSNNFENWNGSSTTKFMQILFDGIEFHCQCMHKHLYMGKIVSFFLDVQMLFSCKSFKNSNTKRNSIVQWHTNIIVLNAL